MPYRLVADAINSGHRYALIYTDLLYQILSVFICVHQCPNREYL